MTTLALFHPTHLVAAELRETLDRKRDLWQRMELLSNRDDEIGTLTEVRGEAAVVAAVDEHSFVGVDVAFFFGPAESYLPLLDGLPETTTAVLITENTDETHGLPIVAGLNLDRITESRTLAVPHPAAVGLALLLHPLSELEPRRLSVTVTQPVSVFGNDGLDELLEQTRKLLSFQSTDENGGALPPDLAFNLLEAPSGTAGIVGALGSVLAQTAFGERELDVSCQLLQSSVFHGFGLSLHLDLADGTDVDTLSAALDKSPYLDLDQHPHRFGPKSAVAKEQILVGSPTALGNGRFTLWAALDQLTIGGTDHAVAILEALSSETQEH